MRNRDYTWDPLEIRVYKYKNPSKTFFCPLCRTQRAFVHTPRLMLKHYIQIAMLTVIFVMVTYPLMEFRGFPIFFVFWGVFELTKRWIFREEIPCPHCGFDASWYKKNVPTAKRLVEEFWKNKDAGKSDIESAQGAIAASKKPSESAFEATAAS